MTKKTRLLIMAFILVGLTSSVMAEPLISIRVNPEFRQGEEVIFSYIIQSETVDYITFSPSTSCDGNAPLPHIELKTITLGPNISYNGNFTHLTVTEDLNPQTCTAIISVESPYSFSVQKNYTIITDPPLDFRLVSCTTSSCDEHTALFPLSDTAYLDYESNVEEISVSGSLVLPDGSKEDVSIPKSIKLKKEGTYTLDVTASKVGYKQATGKLIFYAVEEGSEIPSSGICNADGTCNGAETSQNCPQDCSTGEIGPEAGEEVASGQQEVAEPGKKTGIPLIYLIFLIPILVIIGLTIYLLRLRKKQKEDFEF